MSQGVALAGGDTPRDRAPTLPSGWVTFVFTDMVDSTRVLKALGDEADACFDRHDELLRTAWRRHGGHEINTEGDLFFVAFEHVGDAIAACATAQQLLADEQWPGRAQVAVRMGIHAGYGCGCGARVRRVVHQPGLRQPRLGQPGCTPTPSAPTRSTPTCTRRRAIVTAAILRYMALTAAPAHDAVDEIVHGPGLSRLPGYGTIVNLTPTFPG